MSELMRALDNDGDISYINGIAFRNKNRIIINKPRKFMSGKQLDELPFPAWDMVPLLKYYHPHVKNNPSVPILASRGCPHRCTFCSEANLWGRKPRFRDPNSVIDEIEYNMNKYKIRNINFLDSTFTLSQINALKICELIISRDLGISWYANARVDTISKFLLEKMKLAGCHRIYFGIESGSQHLLDLIKKDISIEQAFNAIKISKDVGLDCEAGFILGLPGEDMQDIKRTIEFTKMTNPDSVQFSILLPLPGSEIYEKFHIDDLVENSSHSSFHQSPIISLSTLSVNELIKTQQSCYKLFYFRPTYLLKKIINDKKYMNPIKTIKSGINILKLVYQF